MKTQPLALTAVLAVPALGIAVFALWMAWKLERQASARQHNDAGVAMMDPGARNFLGYAEAAGEFQAALQLWPSYHLARVNLGIALFRAGRAGEAEAALKEAEATGPEDPRIHYTLGLVEADRGRFGAAERRFAKVLAGDPDDPSALLQLGIAQDSLGDLEAAEATFRQLVGRWPSSRAARYRLGRILVRSERHEEAGELFLASGKPSETAARFTDLPLGPIGRMRYPIERYAQAVADPKTARHAEYPRDDVDVSRELGVSFQHAGTSSDPDVRQVLAGVSISSDWFRSSENRRRLVAAIGAGCGVADFDNDGRLDLFLVACDGRHALYAQRADGTFHDVTANSGISREPELGMACVWGDVDDDGWIDLAIAGYGAFRLYRNRRGVFEDVTAESGIASSIRPDTWSSGVAMADTDHDGDLDIYVSCLAGLDPVAEKGTLRFPHDFEAQHDLLFRNNRNGTFSEVAGAWDERARPRKSRGAWFRDVDGDRVIDLVSCGLDGNLRVLLNRLDGSFLPLDGLETSLPPSPPLGESRASGDLDGDGAVEVLINRNGAAARILRDRSPVASWLAVRPVRYARAHGNRLSIGARVEVRSPRGWHARELTAGNSSFGCDAPEVHFRFGYVEALDCVRVTFPSGVRTSHWKVSPDRVLTVQEPDLERGSCPLVFSWSGERFELVSDAISAGILGEQVAPGRYWMPDPDEWLRIDAKTLRARLGSLDLRFVNALEEVTYLDHARLLVVEHPSGTEVYTDERMAGDAANRRPAKIYLLEDLRPIAGAADSLGRDATQSLASADRQYFDRFRRLPFKGFAEDWSLTLDLGAGSPSVLLLHGWTSWNSSASALALLQSGRSVSGPFLEIRDASGSWRLGQEDFGVPAGLPRPMLVDLRDLLREGEYILRIRTNRTVYFDQARVARVVAAADPTAPAGASAMRIAEAPLRHAELRRLGYPERTLPDGALPPVYSYHRIHTHSQWETHGGMYTRYGDVGALLEAADDRLAIMAHGDEIALAFDATGLGPPAGGRVRTYLLYLVGYEKAMDIHGAYPRTVEPLPFRTMPGYPYPEGGYPADPSRLQTIYEWHIRPSGER